MNAITHLQLYAPEHGKGIISLNEALIAGWALVREHAGSISITNTGSQLIFILAGEPLIGQWQTRSSILVPSESSLFIPRSFLNKKPAEDLKHGYPPWQEGCLGLLSSETLEILPTPQIAAQLWPTVLTRHKQALNLEITSGILKRLDTLKIEPCPTVGEGEAFAISGVQLEGRALVFQGNLVHLYLAQR